MPPSGWSISNYSSQWSVSSTGNAGGTSPEAKFTWTSATSTTRLRSPYVGVSGSNFCTFVFKHYLDDYSASSYSIGVSYRTTDGPWIKAWEVYPSGNMGPEEITLNLDITGFTDLQICFVINGNFYNLDYWYLDDIELFLPLNLDAELSAITTPSYLSGNTDVAGTIRNMGSTQINSLDINWQIYDGSIQSTGLTGLNLNFGDTYNFLCNGQISLPIGSPHNLKVWIATVNGVADDNPSNDLLTKMVQVISNSVAKRPCMEEFTSSTCPSCTPFNNVFIPWCNTYANNITLIKYQMNWPGNGDPYYTAEGGVRKTYYGVSSVPSLFLNGTATSTNISSLQAGYNAAIQEQGLMSLVSSFTLSGTTMNLHTTILPYAHFNNFRAYMIVFEKMTTGNIGGNGETEFHHVMMKMVPDANGTSINLVDRIPQTFNQSVNLSGTNIEEWNDLGVAVIIQNYSSKEIFQSGYGIQNGVFSSNANLSSLMVSGVPVPGFSPDIYSYDVELPYGSTEIPVVSATTQDANATPIIIPTFSLPGTTTIDVFAEDLSTQLTYSVNFSVSDTYYINLKAYCEGPFNGLDMNTDLNQSGDIPLMQPYNVSPWNYYGIESVGSIPNGDVVDWILVELRDATDAANANGSTTIARKAAFLLNNGSVTDMDGFSLLSFDVPVSNYLFLVLWHRNHLGILSNYALHVTDGVFSYDFSDSSDKYFGTSSGHKQLSPTIYGMISGDGNKDGDITYNDKSDIWQIHGGEAGYQNSDFNLDGQSDNADKDDFLLPNLGSGSQVPD